MKIGITNHLPSSIWVFLKNCFSLKEPNIFAKPPILFNSNKKPVTTSSAVKNDIKPIRSRPLLFKKSERCKFFIKLDSLDFGLTSSIIFPVSGFTYTI